MAKLILTKKSHTAHIFTFVRNDGTQTVTELETRSMLRHDFAHYVVESIAELRQSFFGMLESGIDIGQFLDKAAPLVIEAHAEGRVTESVVVQIQSETKKDVDAEVLCARIIEALTTMGQTIPTYLTAENIALMQQRFRLLYSEWQSMKTGESMTLVWDF